jgi:hypothetical protein
MQFELNSFALAGKVEEQTLRFLLAPSCLQLADH